MTLAIIFNPPLGWALETMWGGQALGEVPIDSIEVAPDGGYSDLIAADRSEEITVGHTYVVRTMDGGHAIFTPLSLAREGMTFVYEYQDDGSGVFIEKSPVLGTTWGRIKVRFRGPASAGAVPAARPPAARRPRSRERPAPPPR